MPEDLPKHRAVLEELVASEDREGPEAPEVGLGELRGTLEPGHPTRARAALVAQGEGEPSAGHPEADHRRQIDLVVAARA